MKIRHDKEQSRRDALKNSSSIIKINKNKYCRQTEFHFQGYALRNVKEINVCVLNGKDYPINENRDFVKGSGDFLLQMNFDNERHFCHILFNIFNTA